jgi:hypothetical protein
MGAASGHPGKPAADRCYICEKPLQGQPVSYLDIGPIILAACQECTEQGERCDLTTDLDEYID